MDLRDRLPLDKVIHCTRSLLEEAGYELEIRPSYPGGMLRLYFTLAGEWITEDRIAPPSQLPPAP